MNPDGTIAGAQGINITDSNGRIIPVSLSVSLPISSLGISSLPESGQPANVSSSEGDATAAAAAAAVSQIYSNQQSNSVLEGQFITGQVISDDVGGQDMNKDNSQGLTYSFCSFTLNVYLLFMPVLGFHLHYKTQMASSKLYV